MMGEGFIDIELEDEIALEDKIVRRVWDRSELESGTVLKMEPRVIVALGKDKNLGKRRKMKKLCLERMVTL